jgi:tetratricopeptide (TPR) repeat protein
LLAVDTARTPSCYKGGPVSSEAWEKEEDLGAIHGLGMLYTDQGKLGEAEEMLVRALQGYEEALEPKHTSTLETVVNLSNLYKDQGELGEAEKMFMQAMHGYEEALGPDNVERYIPALNTMWNVGNLFQEQKEPAQAKPMFERAFAGFKVVLGASCAQSQQLERALASLDAPKSKSRTLVARIRRRICKM